MSSRIANIIYLFEKDCSVTTQSAIPTKSWVTSKSIERELWCNPLPKALKQKIRSSHIILLYVWWVGVLLDECGQSFLVDVYGRWSKGSYGCVSVNFSFTGCCKTNDLTWFITNIYNIMTVTSIEVCLIIFGRITLWIRLLPFDIAGFLSLQTIKVICWVNPK